MLKIATIGAGGRGRMSKMAHQPQNGFALSAICDVSPKVREEYAKEFEGIATFSDYKELLAAGKYDAIFVMTQIGRAHV